MADELQQHVENLRLLAWQADILRSQADTDLRRAKFRFVHTLHDVRARHPMIARIAWWYWRYWLQRGWDARKIAS